MSRRSRLTLGRGWLTTVLLCALAGAAPAMADDEPVLATHPADTSEVILVQVDPQARTADKRAVRERLGVGPREVGLHAYGWRSYRLAEGTTSSEARLLLQGTVAGAVEVDQELRAFAIPNDPHWSSLWGLTDVEASAAWDAHGAAGEVLVAVVDTGIQITHPDLSGEIWTNSDETPGDGIDNDGNGFVDDVRGWDFFNGDNSVYDDVNDDHGTHVAGTIGATRNNAQGIAGITDNVRIMPIKFLGGPDGTGSITDAIDAIEYAVDNGADVINSSWGGGYSQAVCDAVSAATTAGVVHVSAAGNGGSDGVGDDISGNTTSPGSCTAPGNVTVAATTQSAGITTFSNFSATRVDIGAPGAGVRSAIPVSSYATWNGTSMAAPHVAGAAALLIGLDPRLGPADVERRIVATGKDTVALAGKASSGRRLNLLNLVQSVTAPSVNPPGPPTLQSPAAGAIANASTVGFSWAPPQDLGDGVQTYELAIDGVGHSSFAHQTTSTTVAGLPDGPHTWSVNAVGPGGGASLGTAAFAPARTVIVDATPPEPFGLVVPSASGTARPTVSWATSDATTGVAGYAISVDGVHKASGGADFTTHTLASDLTPGTHTITVAATDRAGHVRNATASITYTPSTAPSLPELLTEPRSRTGSLRAVRGTTLIPVVRSRTERTAVFSVTVTAGKRRVARQRGAIRIPAGSAYARITLSSKVLNTPGRTIVRWRKQSRPFARWYGRAITPVLRAQVVRQRAGS